MRACELNAICFREILSCASQCFSPSEFQHVQKLELEQKYFIP